MLLPLRVEGVVVKGFGRGGKELGTPTANLDDSATEFIQAQALETGIYYGLARILQRKGGEEDTAEAPIFNMVMSIGHNPYYKNERLSAEVHLMHDFGPADFYGERLAVVIAGRIRSELDFASLAALKAEIENDKRHASKMLADTAHRKSLESMLRLGSSN